MGNLRESEYQERTLLLDKGYQQDPLKLLANEISHPQLDLQNSLQVDPFQDLVIPMEGF